MFVSMGENISQQPVIPVPGDHIPVTSDLQPERTRTFTKAVVAWGLWDMSGAAFNAIVTTFVFSVYLTNAKLFGPDANSQLGYALSVAGILVAVIAPALGQSVDRSGKSALVLRITTLLTVAVITGLFFVSPQENRLWLGLFLLAVGNVLFETGSVIYNAMISDISTPSNVGRISGFGWGLGYIGGIILLLILFVGFIQPEVGWFGVTAENGLNVRAAMLVAALWTLVLASPLLISANNKPRRNDLEKLGIVGSYRRLFASIRHLWQNDRSVVWFLISSAIYRDGLAGVFTFGAILASAAFGFAPGEVIIFGIVANVVAGIATISFGYLDDRLGSRAVIVISVTAMILFSLIVFFGHDGIMGMTAKHVYWIFGLGLCIFVGPTQSASRTYLARIAPKGEEAELFGLYATTGRAVSFLAPFMYAAAIGIAANVTALPQDKVAYTGILGIAAVLVLGLLAFLPVKTQASHAKSK